MRIIAGQFRGTRLAALGTGDATAHLRPTADRVRESLFNVLMGGALGPDPISDAKVLDLFAGTGALGLEALSRGAERLTLVDNGPKALALIRQNLELCHAGERAQVIRRDATRLGPAPIAHDLVFLDPPYGKGLGEKALAVALAEGWIAPDSLIVWEESARMAAPEDWAVIDERRYGDTHVTFLRATD